MITSSNVRAEIPTREYWCFISYRHLDNKEPGRQWATWLHQQIENYEVPPDLVGKRNARGDEIPSRIFPVFRDEEELPADSDLGNPIRQALDRSKLIVVLCSPRAVESVYVAEEIRHFKASGKSDRVLAAILDGEPGSSSGNSAAGDRECFPLPLRHPVDKDGNIDTTTLTEPIAADFRFRHTEEGWTSPEALQQDQKRLGKRISPGELETYSNQCELAKLKIISGILGLPLGELTQRDKAYQLIKAKRRATLFRRISITMGVLVLTAAASGVFAWVQKAKAERETERATRSLASTEKMVRYTLSDLTPRLSSMGRLDVMRGVSQEIRRIIGEAPFDPDSSASMEFHSELNARLGGIALELEQPEDAAPLITRALEISRALEKKEPSASRKIATARLVLDELKALAHTVNSEEKISSAFAAAAVAREAWEASDKNWTLTCRAADVIGTAEVISEMEGSYLPLIKSMEIGTTMRPAHRESLAGFHKHVSETIFVDLKKGGMTKMVELLQIAPDYYESFHRRIWVATHPYHLAIFSEGVAGEDIKFSLTLFQVIEHMSKETGYDHEDLVLAAVHFGISTGEKLLSMRIEKGDAAVSDWMEATALSLGQEQTGPPLPSGSGREIIRNYLDRAEELLKKSNKGGERNLKRSELQADIHYLRAVLILTTGEGITTFGAGEQAAEALKIRGDLLSSRLTSDRLRFEYAKALMLNSRIQMGQGPVPATEATLSSWSIILKAILFKDNDWTPVTKVNRGVLMATWVSYLDPLAKAVDMGKIEFKDPKKEVRDTALMGLRAAVPEYLKEADQTAANASQKTDLAKLKVGTLRSLALCFLALEATDDAADLLAQAYAVPVPTSDNGKTETGWLELRAMLAMVKVKLHEATGERVEEMRARVSACDALLDYAVQLSGNQRQPTANRLFSHFGILGKFASDKDFPEAAEAAENLGRIRSRILETMPDFARTDLAIELNRTLKELAAMQPGENPSEGFIAKYKEAREKRDQLLSQQDSGGGRPLSIVEPIAVLECSLILAEKTPFGPHDRRYEISKALRLMQSIEPELTKQFPEFDMLGRTSKDILRILVAAKDPGFLREGSLALTRVWKEASPDARKKQSIKEIPKEIILANARAWAETASPITAHDVIFINENWSVLSAADEAVFIEQVRTTLGERLSSAEGAGLRAALDASLMEPPVLRPGAPQLMEVYKELPSSTTDPFGRFIRWYLAAHLLTVSDASISGQLVAEHLEAGGDLVANGDETNAMLANAAFQLQHRILVYQMNHGKGQLEQLQATERALALSGEALRGGRGHRDLLVKITELAEAHVVLSVQSENYPRISESLAQMGWCIAAMWAQSPHSSEAQKRLKGFLGNSRTWCERMWNQEMSPSDRENMRAIAVVRWILHDMMKEAAENSTLLFAQNNREIIDRWQAGGEGEELSLTGEDIRDLARDPGRLAAWSREFFDKDPRSLHTSLLAESISLYAVGIGKQNAEAHWQRAVILDESNRPAEAVVHAREAYQLEGSNLSYLNTLAVILARADEIGEARATYARLAEKAKALSEDDANRVFYEKNIRSFEERWGAETP